MTRKYNQLESFKKFSPFDFSLFSSLCTSSHLATETSKHFHCPPLCFPSKKALSVITSNYAPFEISESTLIKSSSCHRHAMTDICRPFSPSFSEVGGRKLGQRLNVVKYRKLHLFLLYVYVLKLSSKSKTNVGPTKFTIRNHKNAKKKQTNNKIYAAILCPKIPFQFTFRKKTTLFLRFFLLFSLFVSCRLCPCVFACVYYLEVFVCLIYLCCIMT